ncbi:response regulator [Thermodesulfobacterium hydrogeniphilum]|uniref:response regulator n=1 Tax=Thermodesulfobacterium hydrogeniphilum TaxID=161156 RepID=UPI000571ADF2|nr:response regulator [Thermodesulfobacterium hydrogeniphilum]
MKNLINTLKILIVDDDKFYLDILKYNLKKICPNVKACSNPKEALKTLKNEQFNILIVNYRLPYINGLELANVAKQFNPDLETILLTTKRDISYLKTLNVAIDKYILKDVYSKTINNLIKVIENLIQNKICKNFTLEKPEIKLESSKLINKYLQYQQKEAFKKQKEIINNELISSTYWEDIPLGKKIFYFKTFYKPIEILSGDTYSIRILEKGKIFFFIFDVMGKSIPGSITAVTATAFINYLINILPRLRIKENLNNNEKIFDFLVKEFIYFINSILLENEVLCALFLLMDVSKNEILVSNFGMPPLYIIENSKLKKIYSEQLPISKYTHNFKKVKIDLANITKMLILSDGILTAQASDYKFYFKLLDNDFLYSNTFKDWLCIFYEKIKKFDDDLTAIYINSCEIKGFFKSEFEINSNLIEINKFLTLIYKRLQKTKYFNSCANKFLTIMNELLLNAHEHGSLKLSPQQKEKFIINGNYSNFVANAITKKIKIKFVLSISKKELYIIIKDEGSGFNKKDILENGYKRLFSGYGFKIINQLAKDFFFNLSGNTIVVIFDLKNCFPKKL